MKSSRRSKLFVNELLTQDTSIAQKIYASIGIIVFGYTMSMLCVIVEGRGAQKSLTTVSGTLFPASLKSQAALAAFDLQTKAYEDAVTVGDKKLLDVAKEKGEAAVSALHEIEGMKELGPARLKAVRGPFERLKSYRVKAQSLYAEMASGKMDQMEQAAALAKESSLLREELGGLTQSLSNGLRQEISAIQDAARRDQLINVVTFLCIVAASVAMIGVVVGSTIRRIRGTVERLRDISEGQWDLTLRLDDSRQDELGALAQCINLFVARLQDIVRHLSGNAVQLAESCSRLNSARLQIAGASNEVAGEAGSVAAASGQMAATAGEIAQSCRHAAKSARSVIGTASDGSAVVRGTVEGMARIASRVQATALTIGSLGSRSDQIGEIIGTIDDIADQTNLLALNAAIEAARAGEHGRGFAVVADEVRALAERTSKATREIGEMIQSIQGETRSAVAAMEEGVKEVEQGTARAEQSGNALNAILAQVHGVAEQVDKMATAAGDQTSATEEINGKMRVITGVMQRTAQDAQESADATSQLDALARNLQELVAQFKVA